MIALLIMPLAQRRSGGERFYDLCGKSRFWSPARPPGSARPAPACSRSRAPRSWCRAAMSERGRAVVEAIRAAGGDAQFAAADLRAAGACERLVGDTIERLGGLDILVNNAGILYTANALDTSDEQWLDTMAVNVNALFYSEPRRGQAHEGGRRGAIVNVASEWGLNGEANHVAYCASKGAVIQITRCMALDHARDNIRVNSVCPGEIHTRMVDDILAKRGGEPRRESARTRRRNSDAPIGTSHRSRALRAFPGIRSRELRDGHELERRRRQRRHRGPVPLSQRARLNR